MAGEEDTNSNTNTKIIPQQAPSTYVVQRTPEPWENSNHPLYLYHSDQPGAVLVSQPLMEDIYIAWVQSMTMALTIKNKKVFIDGTLTRPLVNPDEQNQWDRCNILVKTCLLAFSPLRTRKGSLMEPSPGLSSTLTNKINGIAATSWSKLAYWHPCPNQFRTVLFIAD
ncbi:hypothetical protein ACLB2K_059880 [Fragaria x ananassa]